MANLKIKKMDLKGPVAVGHGWLSTVGWAVRVGDDKRLVDLSTLNAGFAGLDSSTLHPEVAKRLDNMAVAPCLGEGFFRTNVLIEDEDGKLTRVYKNVAGATTCLNEDFVRILGQPQTVLRRGSCYVCQAGVIAPTTAVSPTWVWDVV